jgi:hypothetical protein
MKRSNMLFTMLAAAAAGSCTTTKSGTKMDVQASEHLNAMCSKLAAAKTLRFRGVREASKAFTVGMPVAERAKVSGVVKRPGQLVARSDSELGRRTVVYDGAKLMLIDATANTHATTASPGGIDAMLEGIAETYGFVPPLAEVFANDPRTFLLKGASSVSSTGKEIVAGQACDRVQIVHPTTIVDVWINEATSLPVQVKITYPGDDTVSATARITSLELDVPVNDAELSASPSSSSHAVDMVPLTD